MTDNPQWQPGQPPPPPNNNPQPYAAESAQPGDAPAQGGQWQDGQPQGGQWQGSQPQGGQWQDGQPQGGQPQGGQWQGGPPQGNWQGQPAYQSQAASGEERTWMILAHLSAPIAFIVSAGSLSFLGPLLIWFLRKDSSPRIRQAAAGAFNFNLTFWILYLLGWVVGIVTLTLGFLLVIPFWIVIFLIAAYVHIKGALRAAGGESYDYPFQLKVLS